MSGACGQFRKRVPRNCTLSLLPPSCHPPHPPSQVSLCIVPQLPARKPVCKSLGGPWSTKQACGVERQALGTTCSRGLPPTGDQTGAAQIPCMITDGTRGTVGSLSTHVISVTFSTIGCCCPSVGDEGKSGSRVPGDNFRAGNKDEVEGVGGWSDHTWSLLPLPQEGLKLWSSVPFWPTLSVRWERDPGDVLSCVGL